LTLVVDVSFSVRACLGDRGFAGLRRQRLVAPPLMWAEARSALHEAVFRGELSAPDGSAALDRLLDAPIAAMSPHGLGRAAWQLADELGWAKTHDAEYVALARLLGCRLLTNDEALRRGTARLGIVIGPAEL